MENVVLKIKLTIVECWRDRNIGIYILPTFLPVAEIPSCPWTKQSHLGKCSNGKLRNWTSFYDKTLRSTANFASVFSNVNNVKILDLLEFLVRLLFFPFVPTRKSFAESCKNMGTSMTEILFWQLKKISDRSSFRFSPATLQKHTWMATFLWRWKMY